MNCCVSMPANGGKKQRRESSPLQHKHSHQLFGSIFVSKRNLEVAPRQLLLHRLACICCSNSSLLRNPKLLTLERLSECGTQSPYPFPSPTPRIKTTATSSSLIHIHGARSAKMPHRRRVEAGWEEEGMEEGGREGRKADREIGRCIFNRSRTSGILRCRRRGAADAREAYTCT